MHPVLLVPLLSSVLCMGVGAAIAARDPERRSNRLTSAILGVGGGWSLLQVLWITAENAASALLFARLASAFSLLLAPLAFLLLIELQPRLAPRLGPWRRPLWVLTAGCAAVCGLSPWVTVDMRAAPWGYTLAPGPAIVPVFVTLSAVPIWGVYHWLRMRPPVETDDQRRDRRLEWAVAISVGLCSLMETALPAAGWAFPRLTGAPVGAWGLFTFWTVYRFRAPIFDPRSFASEILETLPVGVMLVRVDGCIRSTNGVLAELAGYAPQDLIGLPLERLLREGRETPVPGAEDEREWDLLRCDGSLVPVSVSDAELLDSNGDRVGYVLVARDLSEVVSLRSRLVTSGRLAAVGQLAAGIAHEINNPIAYVRSNLGLLEKHWAELEGALGDAPEGRPVCEALAEGHELIEECFQGVNRIADIVHDVGGFARTGGIELEAANLADLLEAAARVASPQLRTSARIERHYEEIPPVRCVPQELMQVFLNLVMNASQALGDGGTIRLRSASEDGFVAVYVEDDGAGIAPGDMERIFDPFFTTKPVGEGTGLGLAISRQIVEKYGGEIDVESTRGRGTSFRVRFPLPSSATIEGGSPCTAVS